MLFKSFRARGDGLTRSEEHLENTTITMASIKSVRIAIIGAGMGGLATALALAHHGFENIHIYEAGSDLGFVGAGIQVTPNLSRILHWLGVWEYMKDDAVEMKEFTIRGMQCFRAKGSAVNNVG